MSNDKWRTKAHQILSYLAMRAVGHTHQMIHGLNDKGRVIVATGKQRRLLEEQIEREKGSKPASVHSLEDLSTLAGLRGPLAIDHFALSQLLFGLLAESDAWRDRALKAESQLPPMPPVPK